MNNLSGALDFNATALVLRAERQRILASNIANADTPGYVARDFKFADALRDATQGAQTQLGGQVTNANHLALGAGSQVGALSLSQLAYSVQSQPNADGNSVDLDRERANFADNTIRYEATLRFLNNDAKTLLSAITGQ